MSPKETIISPPSSTRSTVFRIVTGLLAIGERIKVLLGYCRKDAPPFREFVPRRLESAMRKDCGIQKRIHRQLTIIIFDLISKVRHNGMKDILELPHLIKFIVGIESRTPILWSTPQAVGQLG
jgi:hypothetical protein